MKIAFWSPLHGQAKVTSNMIATAICSSLVMDKTNMIMQTHFDLNNLERPFLGKQKKVVGEYFNGDVGLDALARNIKSEPLDKDIINNCSISFLDQKLNLMPGTNKANKEHYEEKLEPVLFSVINAIEAHHDIVFIDTNSGTKDVLTKKVLDIADLIVVNLNQSKVVLDEFFSNNPFHEKKNVFYIIGGYDKKSQNSVTNIKRMYKDIKSTDISKILYNVSYMDAQSKGDVFSFFERSLESKKDNDDRYFIDSVKDTTEKMMKKCNVNRRRA